MSTRVTFLDQNNFVVSQDTEIDSLSDCPIAGDIIIISLYEDPTEFGRFKVIERILDGKNNRIILTVKSY